MLAKPCLANSCQQLGIDKFGMIRNFEALQPCRPREGPSRSMAAAQSELVWVFRGRNYHDAASKQPRIY